MRGRSGICGSARRVNAGLVWLPVLSMAIQTATAQNPTLKTRSKEDREALFAATHRITMNVQVTDSTGNPVSNLSADDFTIFDNQQPRKIAAFHAIDGAAMYDATRVVILLDAVNSAAPALDAAKDGIFKYLAESRRPFSFPTSFALWFNGHLEATQATTDRNAVGRAFVKMTKGVHSNACSDTPLFQQKATMHADNGNVDPATCRAVHFRDSIAAVAGIAQEQQTGGGRTLLIWVGTGWPALSDEEFQGLSPKSQREYAQEIVSLSRDLRAGQVTLYSISPINREQDGKRIVDPPIDISASGQGSAKTPSAVARRLALHELSQRTGGRVIAASEDVAADVGTCVRDANWYYAVSFNAPPAQNGPGEFHSLAIKVDRPGLQVRTMNLYYSEP